jgi:ureidoglycolate lyase
MRTLRAQHLTGEGFAPFGQVLQAAGDSTAANQGRADRFDAAIDLANVDARAPRLHVSIYRIRRSDLPFHLRLVERHALSPQLFFPNSGQRFLVCACPDLPGGEPDLSGLRAFVGTRVQGIVWRAGVWHSPFAALDADGDFLMQQWQGAGALDCEERPLPEPILVEA